MVMENENNNNLGAGALFAVVFFDGEREIDLGTILITPSMNFKAFQSLISQRIGISPHQITTYFTPLHHHHNHQQRRRPVTNKFDFAAALPESTTSFFWVVLKRSRRVRRRRPKIEAAVSPESEKLVLLRRNPNLDYMNRNSDYMDLMREQMMERERGNLNYGFGIGSDDGASSSGAGSENNRVVFCDVCWNARMEGETPPFHWCKNDAVRPLTEGYRSPAGPIARPAKN
ncbi:hypothetical protein Cgig2_000536 [Carnegiea gigantea]|uniref:DUF7138 domain-containing protein n=1 Tax=Carnegiea gigantea TaxID=171969 RepID=A0A9Q1GU54_9CARY|nr:hypothetical protein Cgig2_000536 [Carnegiea gigantea]